MKALTEKFYVVVLNKQDEVVGRYRYPHFPHSDMIQKHLTDAMDRGHEDVTAKIDKRYVWEEI